MDLTKHFTTRTDDNHAIPVKIILTKRKNVFIYFYTKIGKVCVYYRIKPHVPLLLKIPANSFEFHFCKNTSQVKY